MFHNCVNTHKILPLNTRNFSRKIERATCIMIYKSYYYYYEGINNLSTWTWNGGSFRFFFFFSVSISFSADLQTGEEKIMSVALWQTFKKRRQLEVSAVIARFREAEGDFFPNYSWISSFASRRIRSCCWEEAMGRGSQARAMGPCRCLSEGNGFGFVWLGWVQCLAN